MRFLSFICKLVSCRVRNTWLIYNLYSSSVYKYIRILLKYTITKISKYFFNMLLMNAWKVTRALINSKDITKYLKYL